ncbi:2-octaprenyl-6-methoxyphenyl hydroxylase [Litoribrevibacter albus]|uniref:2-octaprenyl-6-methoxyphenyl hydroxylase n=1 Tax=Litoribrevibacter albus TaxID=1473156 RepID=A0AA37WA44_9GAMM|nr:2-octaprenyl-6-methoxyphenyl hydroxylase [Litoribrevibacter albus]GLQ33131.1 2-octaprenyl-6-methoxyphenyl hydroxylase [Litoribrevibacter albus]
MSSSHQEINSTLAYDYAIVGGGMAGLTMALLLAPVLEANKQRLVIIEAFDPQGGHYQPSFDARSTALSEGTRRILDQLGLWSSLAKRVCAIDQIHVSQKGGFGSTRMSASECQVDHLGYVIENAWFGQCLMDAIAELECVDWLAPAKVEQLTQQEQGQLLTLDDGRSVSTSFLMVADGAQSSLRDKLGIQANRTAYQQHALVCNVSTRLAHQQVAYERFTPNGPLALLPLTESRSALIWSVPEGQIAERMAMSDREFIQLLEQEFGTRLGPITKVGKRASYPLSLMRVTDQVRPGVVLLGNSAHALHPVAGQGFNLIIRDLVCLRDAIEARLASHQNLKELTWLSQYQDHRQLDQWLTTSFSHWLIELFSNDHRWLKRLRELGLIALDRVGPVKATFARQAMGLGLGAN